ncbi:MAG: matrixin family metalloprotease [Planctomycetota bacterium]|jgi:hypothetical protein
MKYRARLQSVLSSTVNLTVVSLLALASTGCPGSVIIDGGGGGNGDGSGNGGSGSLEDGNQDESLTSNLGKTSGEPNGSFSTPVVAVFEDGEAKLQGTVSQVGDMDVYLLGSLSAGDLVTVDTDTDAVSSVLDVSVAVYDAEFRLVYNNDDRTAADLDAFMQWVLRNDSSSYYLVVTHSAFAGTGTFTGGYRVTINVSPGNTVPAPEGQLLLLDFDGGEVDSATLGRQTIVPFEAEAISLRYEGETQTMKDAIVESMRENFEGFDVTVMTTDDGLPGSGVEFSTIFLGGFDAQTFGIAESVDLYDVNRCDDAIIYTESFIPRQFSFNPSAEQLAIAIGNVTAHEAGHLLGLNHVDDDDALMDDVSPPDALLGDQDFMEAPVSDDIIPIGTQDAVLLLTDIVGLR